MHFMQCIIYLPVSRHKAGMTTITPSYSSVCRTIQPLRCITLLDAVCTAPSLIDFADTMRHCVFSVVFYAGQSPWAPTSETHLLTRVPTAWPCDSLCIYLHRLLAKYSCPLGLSLVTYFMFCSFASQLVYEKHSPRMLLGLSSLNSGSGPCFRFCIRLVNGPSLVDVAIHL